MSHTPTPELTEYASQPPEFTSSSPDNALFLERLDTFLQKSLGDIKAFAERESKNYEELRRYIAEWHAKSLFGVSDPKEDSKGLVGEVMLEEKLERVRGVLIETSKVLESLADVAGVQTFLLAVDPHNPHDMGFLGGTLIGREYYRGLRGGGTTGASSFKAYAQKRMPSASQEEVGTPEVSMPPNSVAPPAVRSARQTKIDLYEVFRSQLRKVSGIRKAEMKWTNPERLSLYGVRMVGWPPDIPAANPSSLKASQNQRLLELIERGELKFEKTAVIGLEAPMPPEAARDTSDVAAEDFSWAVDTDAGGGDTAVGGFFETRTAAMGSVLADNPTAALGPSLGPMLSDSGDALPGEEDNLGGVFLTAEGSTGFDEYGFQVEPWNAMMSVESPIEPTRARKRARSSESGVDN